MTRKTYSPNARMVLAPYEDQIIKVNGRLKEYRDHPTRDDLRSAVFVPALVIPENEQATITIHHLWILQRHLLKIGCKLHKGRWIKFLGTVYSYKRLGGKSDERGIKGTWDFSVLPLEAL